MLKKPWVPVAVFTCFLFACSVYISYKKQQYQTPTPAQLQKVFPGNSREIFEQPDKFTLYSLNPYPHEEEPGKTKTLPLFHNFVVLGQVPVTDARQQQTIRNVLYDGIPIKTAMGLCFEPRHGFRAVKAKHTVDVVVCFACHQMQVFIDGKGGSYLPFGGKQRQELDRILNRANIPIAP